MPERRTRTGVEIARTGTFRLSTGDHTFTREQLAAAKRNADSSPQGIRLGIGHIDPRFNAAGHDGDPAFGRVVNLRLAEDGDLLVGDYTDIPDWLDDNLDVAYPGRSLEGPVSGDDLKIQAVKLLGTTPPGISTLQDLQQAIAASGDTSPAALLVTGNLREAFVAAGTNLDDLRDAFYALHPDTDSEWWGVQEVQINPNQLIVEHHLNGTETTFRVPWAVQTDGSFTFGDLIEVAVQYVDIAAASGTHAVVYKAPGSRPAPIKREESIVDPKTLREQLGLAEDASDADVTAKLTELAARPDEATVQEQVAAAAEKAKTDAEAAIAASAPTAEHLAALQADAQAGREAREQQLQADRETFIAAALGDGKVPPAAKDSYLEQLSKGGDIEKNTREFIDGLPKGTVPVTEIGASTSTTDGDQLVTTGLFPQLQEA
jgi:hypothetical protein